MRIDTLGPADCADIAAVMRESYAAAFGASMARADLDGVIARLTAARMAEAMRDAVFLGLRFEGMLGGFVQVGPASPAIRDHAGFGADAPTFEISRLYVRPARQGAGIGSRLLDEALAQAGAMAVLLDVWERNERALRLYRSRGFAVIAEHRPVFDSGPAPEADLIMLRPGAA